MELWKDIPEYDNYQVSNLGKVKSKARKVVFGHSSRMDPERIMALAEDKDGYYRVALSKDGKKKRFFVHRLVGMAWIENPEELPVINHIDGNKQNNELSNLEWCTRSENDLHAFKTGLRQATDGGTRKAVMQYSQDGTFIREYESITEAGKVIGCTLQLIGMACNGKVKTAKGFVWKFK